MSGATDMLNSGASMEAQDLQDRILQKMKEFSAQNPAIAEAMAVMNMTMPEYLEALDAIHGPRIVSGSSAVVARTDSAAL